MSKYKVAHIHSDKKFLKLGDAFFSPEFENEMLFIGNKSDLNEKQQKEFQFYYRDKKSIFKIVTFCKDFDMVVFYSIDDFMAQIILSLPKNIKIGWRFFGFELYDSYKEKFATKTTKAIIDEGLKLHNSFVSRIKTKLRNIGKVYKNQIFLKSISRCDVFFALYEEEYLMLKTMFPNLPQFIQVSLNIDYLQSKPMIEIKKEKYFLVGNSRNIWNNHFDILDIVNRNKNGGNYKATLLVNYGHKGYYFKKLLEFAMLIKDVELIEEFMNFEEFDILYQKCTALVINSKRQLAVNNIRKALEHGTKVYLDKDNSFYDYLKKNNFLVYTIKEFEIDYSTGNLILDQQSAQHNYNQLVTLAKNNSSKKFRDNVVHFLGGIIS